MLELLAGHLERLHFRELSADELIAYLHAVQPVVDELRGYDAFYERVRRTLVDRGHLRPGVLDGVTPPAHRKQVPSGAVRRSAAVTPASLQA
jgi:hypothetical protein